MNKLATIFTRVRPIKKLIIIDDDVETFISFVELLTEEVGGISNLFLLNNEDIFNQNTLDFVKTHDPDIIVNKSSSDRERLKKEFHLPVTDPSEKRELINYSTKIHLFHNDSATIFSNLFAREQGPEVFCTFSKENSIPNLVYALNFGILNNEKEIKFDLSNFKGIQVSQISSIEHFISLFPDHENRLLYLSTGIYRPGFGTSVWTVNRNPDDLFWKSPTIIFGEPDDVKSMVYFWNIRATYPLARIIWLTLPLYEENKDQFKEYTHYCVPSKQDSITDKIKQHHAELINIDSSRYYFNEYHEEWNSFEFTQNIPIIDNKLIIIHPEERLFSSHGFNSPLMLDIAGLDELYFPPSTSVANLFINLPQERIFRHYFARIGRKGLSISIHNFSPLEKRPVHEDINIPDDFSMFDALFKEKGLFISETPTTKMANQIINLVGGNESLDIFTNRQIFDILVKITPPRLEKITRSLTSELKKSTPELIDLLNEEELRESIARIIGDLTTINSSIIINLQTMFSLTKLPKEQRREFYQSIQTLYDKKILLRGKYFSCASCDSKLWYPLDAINDDNKCYGCNQPISIPIFSGDEPLNDYFKLNELFVNSVDQGLLPLLATVNFLFKQPFFGKRFLYNYDIFPYDAALPNIQPNASTRLAEIDLIFTFGRMLGIAEIKADRGFDEAQINRMLKVAETIKPDILLFSTLRPQGSTEVQALVTFLRSKDLNTPAFIVTQENLFTQKTHYLHRYFEVSHFKGSLPVGPIILNDPK